jgi:hypothetical protein
MLRVLSESKVKERLGKVQKQNLQTTHYLPSGMIIINNNYMGTACRDGVGDKT